MRRWGQKNGDTRAKRAALYGMLVALAFLLSYIETLIPAFFWVPGMKLGLANLVIVMALYLFGWKGGLAISFIRVLLVAFSFTNLFSLYFSLAGAAASLLVMAGLKRGGGFGIIGVSLAGGTAHNIAQLCVAAALLGEGVLNYLPVLLAAGAVTGFCIGLACREILKRLPGMKSRD